jgi:peroxiredoxin
MRIPLLVFALLFLAACQQDAPTTTTAQAGDAVGTSVQVDDADGTPAQTASVTVAPDFTLPDTKGGAHSLSDFRGQYVILEWLNYDCPFVRKHYEGENMQATQARWTEEGAVWLAIVSNAPGEQGHFPNDVMNRRSEQHGGRQTAILMDEDGQVGRAYGARTTPQMVVISPEGEILYNGAIDDRPSANRSSLEGATNYVNQVMEEALAGRPISVSATQPYGCAVKYAS